MAQNSDFIWVDDAVRAFNRSREWLLKQVKDGFLSRVEIPGDRKIYLLRSEIEKLLQPKITKGDS